MYLHDVLVGEGEVEALDAHLELVKRDLACVLWEGATIYMRMLSVPGFVHAACVWGAVSWARGSCIACAGRWLNV